MSTRALTWWKSSYSGNTGGDCVEVANNGVHVLIRDSKYRRDSSNDPATEPIISVTAHQWNAFLAAVADRVATSTEPAITLDATGYATLRAADGTSLLFTPAEWTAFTDGVKDGEFDQQATAA